MAGVVAAKLLEQARAALAMARFRGTTETPDYDGEDLYVADKLAFATRGCGCCSCPQDITPQTLAEAIADAEAWLEYLRTLERSGVADRDR